MKGYKKKPLLIVLFSIIYLLNPIANLTIIFLSNRTITPFEHISRIVNLISSGNIIALITVILWLSAFPLAYGLYKVRTWAWYYFIIHSLLIILTSLIVKTDAGIGYKIEISKLFYINLMMLIPIGFFIQKEIRAPYLNPTLRWWEQASRIKHNAVILINNMSFKTYDISQTGSFILNEEGTLKVEIGEILPIEIKLNNDIVKCYSEVIWNNIDYSKGTPIGTGIKFIRLDRTDKKIIKNYIYTLLQKGIELKR